jgi:prepilin-type N-terminal cleavage/methylation domain-containing protein
MANRRKRNQGGFTMVEMLIAMLIVAVLGSIAIAKLRDYTRRARISNVVYAVDKCKNAVSEGYLTYDSAPDPGRWGCESPGQVNAYAAAVQTSSDGVIRASIQNLDGLMNGRYVYLVPARANGSTPMSTPNDLGRGIGAWICGSDWQPVRNSLPANCRADTTIYSSQDFN